MAVLAELFVVSQPALIHGSRYLLPHWSSAPSSDMSPDWEAGWTASEAHHSCALHIMLWMQAFYLAASAVLALLGQPGFLLLHLHTAPPSKHNKEGSVLSYDHSKVLGKKKSKILHIFILITVIFEWSWFRSWEIWHQVLTTLTQMQ